MFEISNQCPKSGTKIFLFHLLNNVMRFFQDGCPHMETTKVSFLQKLNNVLCIKSNIYRIAEAVYLLNMLFIIFPTQCTYFMVHSQSIICQLRYFWRTVDLFLSGTAGVDFLAANFFLLALKTNSNVFLPHFCISPGSLSSIFPVCDISVMKKKIIGIDLMSFLLTYLCNERLTFLANVFSENEILQPKCIRW